MYERKSGAALRGHCFELCPALGMSIYLDFIDRFRLLSMLYICPLSSMRNHLEKLGEVAKLELS